jgi:predicted DNA-binding transcriptional regulator AlpA
MYYNIHEVAKRYGVARHTIWRWVNDEFFPRPLMFGLGTARWSEEDLQAFDVNCATAASRESRFSSAAAK